MKTLTHQYRFIAFPDTYQNWDCEVERYWRALGEWVDNQPREGATYVEITPNPKGEPS